MALPSYRRHRFPPEIIQNAIWLYLRFTLSYRDVEELLAERGLDISYEGIELVSLREKCGPLSGDRGFESGFLQRRVSCEPDFLDQGTDRASCNRPAPEVAATGAPRRRRLREVRLFQRFDASGERPESRAHSGQPGGQHQFN